MAVPVKIAQDLKRVMKRGRFRRLLAIVQRQILDSSSQ
jgi:hypothetical protein